MQTPSISAAPPDEPQPVGQVASWPVRVAEFVTTATLVAAILIAGFIAYGLVDNRWYHVVAVVGGSMSPTIEPGDLIVITRPPAKVEVGMILTLEVDGAVVTHRVTRVDAAGKFVTKGDANDVADDYSANTVRVVGQYQFRIPWLGSLLPIAPARDDVSGAYFVAQDGFGVDASTGQTDTVTAGGAKVEPAPETGQPSRLQDPTDPPIASVGPEATPTSGSPSPTPPAPSPPAPEPSADEPSADEPTSSMDPSPTPDPSPSAEPPPAAEPPPSPEATAQPSMPAGSSSPNDPTPPADPSASQTR